MTLKLFLEILESLERNKHHTIMSGIGISWGIFIMMVLLGISNGFEKGVLTLFSGYTKNTTYVYANETTKPYYALPAGRKLSFCENDLKLLKHTIKSIKNISPEISDVQEISYYNNKGYFNVLGVFPEYFNIKYPKLLQGRLLNRLDSLEQRHVVIIGKNVSEILFEKKNPIGKIITINGIGFTVIGEIDKTMLSLQDERAIYMNYNEYKSIHGNNDVFDSFIYSYSDKKYSEKKITELIRYKMSQEHNFDFSDENAYYFNSMAQQVKSFKNLFVTLKKFIWFIGFSILISGIISIGNIMYSSAKDRTFEIGIRKALGATSANIKTMFLYEAIILTIFFGIVGIILAFIILKSIGLFVSEDSIIMAKPSIDIPTSIAAIFLLTISGIIVGLRPAIYAAKQNPINILR